MAGGEGVSGLKFWTGDFACFGEDLLRRKSVNSKQTKKFLKNNEMEVKCIIQALHSTLEFFDTYVFSFILVCSKEMLNSKDS